MSDKQPVLSRRVRGFTLFLTAFFIIVCFSMQTFDSRSAEKATTQVLIKGTGKVTETEKLALYVDEENGHITVLDKRSGYQWSSLPTGYDTDETAAGRNKAELQSALLLKYYNTEQENQSAVNSYASSARKGGVSIAGVKNGCRITFSFPEEMLAVTVEVTLKDDQVAVTIPLAEIREEGGSLLMEVTPYPFFGAADKTAEGYMLVPDGCGSLIYLNNGKTAVSAYNQPIYGRDVNIVQNQATMVRESVLLPVFGMKNGTHAFLAVVSQGEALGKINAAVAGVKNSYNSIYTAYTIRTTDEYVIGKNSGGVQKSSTVYQKEKPEEGGLQVQYVLLNDEEAGVSGMAAACRRYMEETDGWQKQTGDQPLLFLDFVGATRKPKTILGFPVTGVEPLTTFEQAEQLVTSLQELGVHDVQIRYQQWSKDSLSGTPQVNATPLSELGGRSAFASLERVATENGHAVFPTYDPLTVSKWGKGYWRFLHAAETISGVAAFLYDYDLSTQQKGDGYNLLAYTQVASAAEKFLGKYQKLNNKALALDTVGSVLSSDFSVKSSNRQIVCDTLGKTVKRLAEEYDLMVDGGALYAVRYASNIVNLPDTDSGFSLTDETVPFYQMVIHGYKSYAAPAINLLDESRDGFLRAIETGGSLHYTWIAAEASVLQSSEDESLFGVHAGSEQVKAAAEQYAALKEIREKTAGAFIVDHRKLADNVVLTVYDNGVRTVVNYADEAYMFEGAAVESHGYSCR